MIGNNQLVSMVDRYPHVAPVFCRAHRKAISTLPILMLSRIIPHVVLEGLHMIDEPFLPEYSPGSGIPNGVEHRGWYPRLRLSLYDSVDWMLRGSINTCLWDETLVRLALDREGIAHGVWSSGEQRQGTIWA